MHEQEATKEAQPRGERDKKARAEGYRLTFDCPGDGDLEMGRPSRGNRRAGSFVQQKREKGRPSSDLWR